MAVTNKRKPKRGKMLYDPYEPVSKIRLPIRNERSITTIPTTV